jgi:hypothetical protein
MNLTVKAERDSGAFRLADLCAYPTYYESGDPWVGALPEGWTSGPVRRFSRVLAGATPSRSVPEYWDGGSIPWLASGDVNLRWITSARRFITEAGYKASSTKWIQNRSVVLALAGQGRTKGMVAALEVSATCNQSLAALEPQPERLDHRYLSYYLESRYLDIRALVGDDVRDGLNLEHVRSIPITMPPIDEQRLIVQFLMNFDLQITSARDVAGRLLGVAPGGTNRGGLLNELRGRVVADVSAGRLDIRGVEMDLLHTPDEIVAALAGAAAIAGEQDSALRGDGGDEEPLLDAE